MGDDHTRLAHVAQQVVGHQLKARGLGLGVASRGEFTDAAMGARAECVMLNRGPFVADGVRTLADVLGRAERHLDKKTPQLTRLRA